MKKSSRQPIIGNCEQKAESALYQIAALSESLRSISQRLENIYGHIAHQASAASDYKRAINRDVKRLQLRIDCLMRSDPE